MHAPLRLMRSGEATWTPPVLTCSGLTGSGLEKLWAQVELHHRTLAETGELEAKRRRQQVDWTWAMVRDTLLSRLHEHPEVRRLTPELERQVQDGELTPTLAADRILEVFAAGD